MFCLCRTRDLSKTWGGKRLVGRSVGRENYIREPARAVFSRRGTRPSDASSHNPKLNPESAPVDRRSQVVTVLHPACTAREKGDVTASAER